MAAQFGWVTSGRIVAAVLQAILLVMLARDAGPDDFGLFSAVFSLATLAQTASGLGVPTLVIRERARSKSNSLLRGGLRLMNPIGLMLAAVVALGLTVLGLTVEHRLMYMVPLAVWAAAERYSDTWLGLAVADGDAHINTVNVVLRRAIALLLYVLCALWWDPILAFSVSLSAAALASAFAVRRQISSRIHLDGRSASAKRVLRKAWPFWLNSIGTQARNLDVAVVTAVAGLSQAGYYAAASRVTSPLRIVSTSLATVLLPMASRGGPRDIKRLMALSAAVVLVMAVVYSVGAAIMPWIVTTFLTDAYLGAVTPLRIVLIGLCFAAAASLLGALLQGIGFQLYVAHTAVVTTIVCLLSAAFGAAVSGASGAAYALLISFFVQMLLLLVRLIMWLRAS
ncbi:oligosaccharide flippase family protein [Pseudarthrobacter siccitolerans]